MKKFDYDKVIGHSLICQKLRQAVRTDRVVSAYLFSGSRGIGKKTVAAAFSGALLCHNPVDGKACGVCSSCRLLAAENHPDLIVTQVPEDKNSIGIELVREQIIKEAYIRPFHAKRKVFVIKTSELMTQEAQNALLKILEEPPAYAIFLLLSEAEDQLLQPVLSRCLKLRFLPLSGDLCQQYFSVIPAEESRKELSVAFSQGNLGRGLLMLNDEAYYKLYCETLEMLSAVLKSKAALSEAQNFFQTNKEQINDVIDFMLVFFRDCMRVSLGHNAGLICTDHKAAIAAFTRTCSAGAPVRITEAVVLFRKRLLKNASLTVAGLELLAKMQEEIHG